MNAIKPPHFSNNYISNGQELLFVLIASLICGCALIIITNMAFVVSEHPIASLLMRVISLCLLVILAVTKKKENVVYAFIMSYPFISIAFSGISIVSIYSVSLMILYSKEIIHYNNTIKDIFKLPFIVIGISIIYTTCIAQYPYVALTKAILLVVIYIIYLVLTVFIKTQLQTKNILTLLTGVSIFACIVVCWQIIFGIDSIRFFFFEYNQNVGLDAYVKRIPSFFDEAQSGGLFFAFMAILLFGAAVNYYYLGK